MLLLLKLFIKKLFCNLPLIVKDKDLLEIPPTKKKKKKERRKYENVFNLSSYRGAPKKQILWHQSHWPSPIVHPCWKSVTLASQHQPCCLLLWKHLQGHSQAQKAPEKGTTALCHSSLSRHLDIQLQTLWLCLSFLDLFTSHERACSQLLSSPWRCIYISLVNRLKSRW